MLLQLPLTDDHKNLHILANTEVDDLQAEVADRFRSTAVLLLKSLRSYEGANQVFSIVFVPKIKIGYYMLLSHDPLKRRSP